jgi:fimbrial chaperone protein
MSRSCFATRLGLLLLTGGLSIEAGSFTVKPVRIELSTRQLRTTIQIQNLGSEPITIQAHIVAWNASGAEEILSDNDDILLNPPIFTVAEGHTQFLRVGLRHPQPDTKEGTYRLILEQVPGPPKPGFTGINTLLKVSVPIFVKPRVPLPELVWTLQRTSDQELRLSVENHGNAHVQIRKFAVTASGAPEQGFTQDAATYVLQNARKEWVIHNEQLAGAGKLLLQGQTDSGDLREDLVPKRP